MSCRRLAIAGLNACLVAAVFASPVWSQRDTGVTVLAHNADLVVFATVDRVTVTPGSPVPENTLTVELRIAQVLKGKASSPIVSPSIAERCSGGGGGRLPLCISSAPNMRGASGIWFLKSEDGGNTILPRNSSARGAAELFLPVSGPPANIPAPDALDDVLLAYQVRWIQSLDEPDSFHDENFIASFDPWGDPRPTQRQTLNAIAPLLASPIAWQHIIGLIIALRVDSADAMTQVVNELPVLRLNLRFPEIVFAIGGSPSGGPGSNDPRWIAPLRQYLALHADVPGMDAAVAGALYRIGTSEAHALIAELLNSKDPGARGIAARTLGVVPPSTLAMEASHDPNIDQPYINQGGMVRGDTNRVGILSPGLVFSIYGRSFGPAAGCSGPALEVCGVQVLLDGKPIEIEHVNQVQINARIPDGPPGQSISHLVVVSGGRSSDPAEVRRLPEIATISLEGVARVGGPVWIHVDLPDSHRVFYPPTSAPWDFSCDALEVRKDGKLLDPIRLPAAAGAAGGSCGALSYSVPGLPVNWSNRLPLHLQFNLAETGTYEVRLSRYGKFSRQPGDVRIQSGWITIRVLPAVPTSPARSVERPEAPAEIVSDFLPNLLAHRGDETLAVLLEYLYHPSPLVRNYARSALHYWPDSIIEPQLTEIQRTHGLFPDEYRFTPSSH